MEKYSRMVIDLYKESFTDYIKNHQVNSNKILDVEKELACAVTTARIKGDNAEWLQELSNYVSQLKNIAI